MANYKDPVDWFKDDILPDYRDFLADPIERKARHVAISLRHFPERVYKVYAISDPARIGSATSPNDLVNQLASQCPELKTIRAVGDPSKHHLPDSKTPQNAVLTTATEAIYTDSNGTVMIGGSINRVGTS